MADGLGQRRSDAVRRVVVRDGEHAESATGGLADQLRRREAPVGRRRVRVKIYRATHESSEGGFAPFRASPQSRVAPAKPALERRPSTTPSSSRRPRLRRARQRRPASVRR
jgi:hypothetical protein